ncbi:MAG: chemotaxis protein CheW [Pseudomonadota bacterium]|nr:chemotaxis protein CheW [Pseudomonadota bacterium]
MTELLLIATVAGERVAIPAADVESVVEIEGVTPVPQSPPHVAGLAALRSRVLTVIDSCASLELGTSDTGRSREAIVIEVDGYAYALLVETVEDVVEYSGKVRPIRTSVAPGWRRVASGMVETESGLMLLIDANSILSGPTAEAA